MARVAQHVLRGVGPKATVIGGATRKTSTGPSKSFSIGGQTRVTKSPGSGGKGRQVQPGRAGGKK